MFQVMRRTASRQVRSICQLGGGRRPPQEGAAANKAAPGRGGGPGAFSVRSAWGKPEPAGETGSVTRGLWHPLRFWKQKMGMARPRRNAIRACELSEKACTNRELKLIPVTLRGGLSQIPLRLHGRLARTP